MDSSEDSENEIVNLSLMAKSYESDEEVSLKKSWYIDSGCKGLGQQRREVAWAFALRLRRVSMAAHEAILEWKEKRLVVV